MGKAKLAFELTEEKMELPTQKQIEAGNEVAADLYDATISKALDDITEVEENTKYVYPDIVQMYLDEKIDTVTGIWLAMQREKNNDTI
jgi:hypothetical protein